MSEHLPHRVGTFVFPPALAGQAAEMLIENTGDPVDMLGFRAGRVSREGSLVLKGRAAGAATMALQRIIEALNKKPDPEPWDGDEGRKDWRRGPQ